MLLVPNYGDFVDVTTNLGSRFMNEIHRVAKRKDATLFEPSTFQAPCITAFRALSSKMLHCIQTDQHVKTLLPSPERASRPVATASLCHMS